jgi:DNA-binding PadR family transcriptional regulator
MSTRLMILGMLAHESMHGYDISKSLQQMRADAWADVLPGSIYHALKQMSREALVEIVSTEHTGNRARAIYGITDTGRRAYLQMLREAWTALPRPFPTGLYVAITFVKDLPPAEAAALIDSLSEAVQREITWWKSGEMAKSGEGVLSDPIRLMFDNGREHLEADLRLLRRLRETFL